jgi:SAM-dependent methyltransferase
MARCSQCQHGFLNPQPQWDELSDYYHSNYSPYQSSHGLADEFDRTVQNARRSGSYRHVEISPGLRVLDIGCGGGSFLAVARALGGIVRGVEPSSFGVRAAREQGLEVFEGTLEDFARDAKQGTFDLITFSHVVEHLCDPIATLSLAKTLLATNGKIWVAVPNGSCYYARSLTWRWHSSDLPLHLHHFSPESMRITAFRAGLSLDSLRTYSLPKAVKGSILQELRYRWKIPRRLAQVCLSQQRIERKAAEMDQRILGEAILAEFRSSIDHEK